MPDESPLGKYDALQIPPASPVDDTVTVALKVLGDHTHIIVEQQKDGPLEKMMASNRTLKETFVVLCLVVPPLLSYKNGVSYTDPKSTDAKDIEKLSRDKYDRPRALSLVRENKDRYSDYPDVVDALGVMETVLENLDHVRATIMHRAEPFEVSRAFAQLVEMQYPFNGSKQITVQKSEPTRSGATTIDLVLPQKDLQ